MEFTLEDISAIKKKAHVTVPAEEVTAALAVAVATIGQDLQLDGFRKGKVPAGVIRKRFHSSVEKEARESLINANLNELVQKTGASPISGFLMNGDDKELVDGEPYSYTIEFEVYPTFDLPNYDGLEVEEETSEPTEDVVTRVINSVATRMSSLETVPGNEPPKKGQVAIIDFEFLENGKPLPDYKSVNFELPIGGGHALKEFENLVTSIPVGHTGTGPLTFPEDFIAPDLAGKTVEAQVTVRAVKERKAPEINDALAEKLGSANVEELRQKYRGIAHDTLKYVNKSETEQKLLNSLLKQVDFEVPDAVARREMELQLSDYFSRLEEIGKRPSTAPEDVAKVREELEPRAKKRAREKVLLLAIAKKEHLDVKPEELARAISEGASKLNENPQEYLYKMEKSGFLQDLHDHMLCDKALDLIYDRANIKIVTPAKEGAEAAQAAASGAEAQTGESGQTAETAGNSSDEPEK